MWKISHMYAEAEKVKVTFQPLTKDNRKFPHFLLTQTYAKTKKAYAEISSHLKSRFTK